METIVRDVKDIELDERRVYESVVGHALSNNQRVEIRITELGDDPEETPRRAAVARAIELARRGRAAADAQGIGVDEADAAIDEALRETRRSLR